MSEKTATAPAGKSGPTAGALLEPDRSKFRNPWNDRALLAYFQNLLRAHGYVRLLGLPQLRDNPDVPIETLFVEPEFSEENISPDRPVEQWPARVTLTEAITTHQRMVVLGDPGLGKTSLLQWLVAQFCRSDIARLPERLGALVPLPFVLRDLPLTADISWEGLLKLFLDQPLAKPLRDNPDLLKDILTHGQALILLDGLDELSSEKTKESLRTAVKTGIKKNPACRWLMTSRVAGYERSPFHDFSVPKSERERVAGQIIEWAEGPHGLWNTTVDEFNASWDILQTGSELLYLAPFNDRQVEAFARNWYAQREADPARRDKNIQDLLSAIRSHDGTQKLARVPNLLTMMALIHRQRAALPQGRVNLYGDIAQAYLHGIDDFRGLKENFDTLPQKKQWLARLAFEMQSLRTEEQGDGDQAGVMVDREQAIEWLAQAMVNDQPSDTRLAAAKFLDYLQRRTGLFMERSSGKWAFLHLSFQEY
ncbi:MAG TPA: NACHT domain-containing protein, partial [Verrucomicrobiae bacterium]